MSITEEISTNPPVDLSKCHDRGPTGPCIRLFVDQLQNDMLHEMEHEIKDPPKNDKLLELIALAPALLPYSNVCFNLVSGMTLHNCLGGIPLPASTGCLCTFYLCCVVFLQGSSFEYYGCYMSVEENISYVNKTFMSRSICIEYCQIGHYSLAALSVKITGALFLTNAYEAYSICSCSNETLMKKVNESLCSFPCPKSPDEICGGYNQTIFSVYGIVMRGYKNTGHINRNTIGIVVGAIFAVICVMVVAVVILILCRKYQTCSTSSNIKLIVISAKGNFMRLLDFQNKSKTDQSIHKCTNESKTKIETDDEDDVKYETVEETNRAARNIHMNESYQQYININENSNKVRRNLNQKSNDNGELYYNIDEQNSQEYEIPMRTESAPHLYSKLNANSEKDNIKSDTQVLEKTEEEYEFMMSQ
ncbi:unnamed protein product [Mytilus edulis]|uniref:WSC domain-containing protein n=1 Tax=Mytilus edulis TaxID=6550 RepID=A0A8S3STS8_MYTED|nr:unnamed protein product [Mytilus edulis]